MLSGSKRMPGVVAICVQVNDCEYWLSPPSSTTCVLGRISPEKRPDRAIEMARDLGMRLVIAAKIDPVDQAYYEHAIAPLAIDVFRRVTREGSDDLDPVRGVELGQDPGDVRLDRGHAHVELGRDVGVRLALTDGDGDVVLALAQPG